MRKIILFFTRAATLVSLGSCTNNANTPPLLEGKIIFAIGKIPVNDVAFKPGQVIKHGDIVKTDAASRVDIQLLDKNIFRLGENGTLVFKISDKESVLEIQTGWLAAVLKDKNLLAKKELHVITPTMTAGIRGTSFFLKVEDPKNVYFCTCNGTISQSDRLGGQQTSVTAAAHAAARYSLDEKGAISVDKNPGLLYHDNSLHDELAKKIAVKIDWEKADY